MTKGHQALFTAFAQHPHPLALAIQQYQAHACTVQLALHIIAGCQGQRVGAVLASVAAVVAVVTILAAWQGLLRVRVLRAYHALRRSN